MGATEAKEQFGTLLKKLLDDDYWISCTRAFDLRKWKTLWITSPSVLDETYCFEENRNFVREKWRSFHHSVAYWLLTSPHLLQERDDLYDQDASFFQPDQVLAALKTVAARDAISFRSTYDWIAVHQPEILTKWAAQYIENPLQCFGSDVAATTFLQHKWPAEQMDAASTIIWSSCLTEFPSVYSFLNKQALSRKELWMRAVLCKRLAHDDTIQLSHTTLYVVASTLIASGDPCVNCEDRRLGLLLFEQNPDWETPSRVTIATLSEMLEPGRAAFWISRPSTRYLIEHIWFFGTHETVTAIEAILCKNPAVFDLLKETAAEAKNIVANAWVNGGRADRLVKQLGIIKK